MRIFLAALKVGLLTPEQIDQHLAAIALASRPLVKSNSARAAQVFQQCLEMQLCELPPGELKHLSQLAQQAPAGPAGKALRHIGREADAALLRVDPLMTNILSRFDRAFQASLAGELDTVDDQLSQAYGTAAMLLQKHHRVGSGEDEFALGQALIKEACALWMQSRQPLNEQQLAGFFQAMPASLQFLWQTTAPRYLSVACEDVDHRLEEAIQRTEAALSQALRSACRAAYVQPSPATLSAIAAPWKALRQHADTLKRPEAIARFDTTLAEVKFQASKSLDLSNLGPDALSNQQLHRLGPALTTLGIAHDSEALDTEIARRKTESNRLYSQAVEEVLTHLAAGDLAQALASLRTANGHHHALLLTHKALEGGGLDVDQQTEMVNQLLAQACQAIAPNDCEQAFQVLNAPQGLYLTEVLMNLGARSGGDQELFAIGQVGLSLQRLRGALAERLNKEGEVRNLSLDEAGRAAERLDDASFDTAQRFTGGRLQRPPA